MTGRQLPLAILASSHGTFSEWKVHVERVHKPCTLTCVPLCECKEEKKEHKGGRMLLHFDENGPF